MAALIVPAAARDQPEEALAHWTAVLKTFVNDQGEVDFQGLAKAQTDLKAFIDYVAKVSPQSAPALFPTRESRLAYHINAYNALTMYGVIDSGIPKSLSGLTKVRFFFFRRFVIGSESMSLYTYENEIIRPLGDERVHFALNCMSVSCPRLPKSPFTANTLNDELDREAHRFFAEPRNLQRIPEKRTVRVSEILKSYTEDFLRRSPSLIAYMNQHVDKKIPGDYKVEFMDYDWTVNDQHRSGK